MEKQDDGLMVRLRWVDPTGEEVKEITESLPITIGRNAANTIELDSRLVSGQHVRLEQQGEKLFIIDENSRNGTVVNGKRITRAELQSGNNFQIATFGFSVTIIKPDSSEEEATGDLTIDFQSFDSNEASLDDTSMTFSDLTDVLILSEPPPPRREEFPPAIFSQATEIPIQDLEKIMPFETTTYLTIGGGLGSFTWVDHLVVFGADPSQIVAIGFESKPYGRYRRLCVNSQIPDHERLRSNSDSCPDNLWGWPGYAMREIWDDLKKFKVRDAIGVGWQIFNEPYVPTYTPRSGQVYASIDKEAKRIGWESIWRHGRVRAIRKTSDGRYVVAYSKIQPGQPSSHRLIVCQYLHVAVGYPGVRFLPDLQKYRLETGDANKVVNAYEEHEFVYDHLLKNGGVVLVRGRGIVASRIIQRLYELRTKHNVSLGILHLMRTPVSEGYRYGHAQRKIENHWEFQPFNWPKAAWSGTLRTLLEKSTDEERDQLLNLWGGTTTADRHDWSQIINDGLREGWYEIQFGTVEKVEKHANGKVATLVHNQGVVERKTELLADFIIDATGLESGIDSNVLLKDLVDHYRLPRNPKQRLKVSNAFEIEGIRNNAGRAYASGVITLGGPYAPVDSFFGLQYAALRSVDDLVDQRAPNLRRLNGLRSLRQWWRWTRGVTP